MFTPRLCNAICRTTKFQNIYINIPDKKNLHVNRMVLQNKPNEQTATEVSRNESVCFLITWSSTGDEICLIFKQYVLLILFSGSIVDVYRLCMYEYLQLYVNFRMIYLTIYMYIRDILGI
jgi:hypothetical protein